MNDLVNTSRMRRNQKQRSRETNLTVVNECNDVNVNDDIVIEDLE